MAREIYTKRLKRRQYDDIFLRGIIIEKFGTQRAFSIALNTTEEQVTRALNGKSFNRDFMMTWIEVLELNPNEIQKCFFVEKVVVSDENK